MNLSVVAVLWIAVVVHVGWTWIRAARTTPRRAETNAVRAESTHAHVCIVVPAWNDAASLPGTLAALEREAAAFDGSVDLVVVAGGDDGSHAVANDIVRVSSHGWNVLSQEPRGKNAALNLGIAATDADVLVFVDADTRVSEGWLAALIAPIVADVADATTGSVSPVRDTPVARIFTLDQLVSQQVDGRCALFGAGTIAVHRRALAAIGGRLPEDVWVGVDWDLSRRVAEHGLRRRYVPSARVVTELPQTWGDYLTAEVRWRRALAASLLRTWRSASWASRIHVGYPFMAGAVLLVGWAVVPAVAAAWGVAGQGLAVWLAFVVWLLGRHGARCMTAARFDDDPRWLRHLPAYLAGYVVSAAASWRAVATIDRISPHFKGRRTREAS